MAAIQELVLEQLQCMTSVLQEIRDELKRLSTPTVIKIETNPTVPQPAPYVPNPWPLPNTTPYVPPVYPYITCQNEGYDSTTRVPTQLKGEANVSETSQVVSR